MDRFPDAMIEALRYSHQFAIFFRLGIDPPLRLWFGINDIPTKIEPIETETGKYLGAGRFNGIPELEVLINGVADRIQFTVSGIDPDRAQELDLESLDVKGAPVHVAITALDEYYQPIVSPIPIWTGRASSVIESCPAVTGTQPQTLAYALSAGAGVPSRERVSASLWSHPQHLALFPGDMFCRGTARLARGVVPSWPRF